MVMDFKFLVVNFLFFSCSVLPDFSRKVGAVDRAGHGAGAGQGGGPPTAMPPTGSVPVIGAGAGSTGDDFMPCMQNLLPCKPYLKSPSPPPSCCGPLKDMVTNDTRCLCKIFNNREVSKSLAVSQEEALKLPKACGANVDISKCQATWPASAPAMPSTPAASGSLSDSDNPPRKSAGNRTPQVEFGGFGLVSLLVSLGFFLS